MTMSEYLLLVIWFMTMVFLYVIIRYAVADGMRDYDKKKKFPKEDEGFKY